MSNSASTKTIKGPAGATGATGTVNWPGSTSQLTSGAGTIVTVGDGLSLGAGTLATSSIRYPIDASDQEVWYLNDNSTTAFANAIAGRSTLTWEANDIFAPAQKAMFRNFDCAEIIKGANSSASTILTNPLAYNVDFTVSIAILVQPTVSGGAWSSGGFVYVFNGTNYGTDKVLAYVNGSNISVEFASLGSSTTLTAAFAKGTLTLLSIVWSGTNGIVYINGEVGASSSVPARSASRLFDTALVNGQGKGIYVAEYRIATVARTQTQIRAFYNSLTRY